MFKRLLSLIVLSLGLSLTLTIQAQSGSITANNLAWSPDGQWLAISSNQGVWIYDVESLSDAPRQLMEDMAITAIAFDQTATYLAVAGDQPDGQANVFIIDLETDEVFQEFIAPRSSWDSFNVFYDMTFSLDDQYLLVGNTSQFHIYDLQANEIQVSVDLYDTLFNYSGPWVTSITHTADPRYFAVTTWGNALTLIDDDGRIYEQFDISAESLLSEAIYQTNTTYLILANEGIYQFDTQTEQLDLIDQPFTERVTGQALSHDQRYLATGSERQLILLDLEDNTILLNIRNIPSEETSFPPYIFALAFNPDDTQLATLQVDGTVNIWDTATGEALDTFDDFDRAISWRWG